jgi:superfamily I DNA/RNA helicase
VLKLLHGMGLFSDLQATVGIFKPAVSKKVLEKLKSWAYQKNLSLAEALVQTRRLPIPQMGRAGQQQLYDFTRTFLDFKKRIESLSVTESLELISNKAGFMEKYSDDPLFIQGYGYLLERGQSHKTDAAAFIAAVALSRDTDVYDHRVEKVALTTMHAAKGLEFPVVFIAGCEDENIPYRSATHRVDMEEERRLFYVALTRAKSHLFLTKADSRRVNGKKLLRQLSPFVNEIENRYKRFSGKRVNKPEEPSQEQLSLF